MQSFDNNPYSDFGLPRLIEPPRGAVETLRIPSAAERGAHAERVMLAGGALNTLLVHPEASPWERLYRRTPAEGMYDPRVGPDRPVSVELGAFKVPQSMALLLFDLRANIYRYSGAAGIDTVPVEARRFSTQLGFSLTVDQTMPANVSFELTPPRPQVGSLQAFQRSPATFGVDFPTPVPVGSTEPDFGQFNLAQQAASASAAGPGATLQPQRPGRFGARSIPFTLYVRSGQVVQVSVVCFRQLTSPIAYFEYDLAGLLLPELWVSTMTEAMKPMTEASGGSGSLGPGPR